MQQTQFHRPVTPKTQAQPQPARHPQRPPSAPRRRWLPYALVGGGFMLAVMLTVCAFSGLLVIYLTGERIPQGVTVAGIALGGEQVEAAETQLQQAFGSATVTLADNVRSHDVLLQSLGISIDYPATVEQAQNAEPGANVLPVYRVDLVQTQNALIDLSERFNVEPVAGDPPQMGRAMDIPVMLDRLRANAAQELADGVLDLVMIEVAPPEPEAVTAQNYTGPSTTHIVEKGQELGLIAKLYNVAMADIVNLNGITNPDLLYVGQELLIPAGGVYVPDKTDAPPPSTSAGKAIVVSVSTQRIYAYENGELIRSHLVSTGLPKTPTVLGDYSVYVKYVADDMSGPDYFLPQVPYTMYFFQGYAVHGTYWHNAFGRAMSHGCVNLPVSEAEWFFNWAQVGTPVRVVA